MHPPYPRVWLSDQDIVHVEFAPHSQISRQIVKQVCKKRFEVSANPSPVLIIANGVSGYDVDATLYLSSEAIKDSNIAYAIVIDGFLTDFIAKEFMRYHKPPCPVEIFDKQEQAINWLLNLAPK